MASAQTEPSMDEILASIRRIISEEDEQTPEVPVRRKLEALELTDDAAADDADADTEEASAEAADDAQGAAEASAEPSEPEAASETPDVEAAAADTPAADHTAEATVRENTDTDALDDFAPMPEEPAAGEATMEPAAVAHDAGEVVDQTFDEPEAPAATPARNAQSFGHAKGAGSPVAPAAMVAAQVNVSDEVAGLAADAFGALEENVRISAGSGRTIEDLVQTMLSPMLKAWLDANLPRIVEEKVEEEVRRIARRR